MKNASQVGVDEPTGNYQAGKQVEQTDGPFIDVVSKKKSCK